MMRPNDQIAEADLPGSYRKEAARLRSEADTAETVEMRITLLDAAQRAEQLATELEQCRL
jgi:hypothetical protein